MALTVATNTGALAAQAAASSVNREMETSMQRLSTGKRINSAADDAAGVAISSRLTSEIRGTNQAIRNAMDAQAMLNTAEGAHVEIESILQRMRELAVQSANDSNNSVDRSNLQAEVDQLTTELNRISAVTTWAGQNLLNGTGGVNNDGIFNFHVGAQTNTSDRFSVTVNAVTASALGISSPDTSTVLGNVTGVTKSGSETTVSDDVNNASISFDGQTFSTGVQSISGSGVTITTGTAGEIIIDATAGAAGATVTVTLNGTDYSAVIGSADATGYAAATAAIATAIGSAYSWATSGGATGNSNEASVSISRGAMAADLVTQLNADAGFSSRFTATNTNTNGITVANNVIAPVLTESDSKLSINGNVLTVGTYTAGASYSFNIDGQEVSVTEATASSGYLNTTVGVASQLRDKITELGLTGFTVSHSGSTLTFAKSGSTSVTNAANARDAISRIDNAISVINTQRANLGAVSNRLDNTVSNLTNISNNLQAGRGRIEDADFATETTTLAKTQILQQASMAMLAQANAAKQNVLSLLQG